MKAWIQLNLIRFIAWVSPHIGKLHSPWAIKKVHARDYREVIAANFDEGTIFLTKTDGELGNLFIPDFWSHAAIYTADKTVIEAVGLGVIETDLIDFMMKKDYIIALRPKFASIPDMSKAVEYARSQKGKPYDFSFQTSDVEAFYCSELIQWSYNQVNNKEIPFKIRKVLGVDSVTPDDIATSEHFQIVWESESLRNQNHK